MKKLAIIGLIVTLMIVGVFLWLHYKHPSDAKIGHSLVGTWTHNGSGNLTISADGSYSALYGSSNSPIEYEGAWLVKDGVLVMTTTKATGEKPHDKVGSIGRYKIIKIDDRNLAFDVDGQANNLQRR